MSGLQLTAKWGRHACRPHFRRCPAPVKEPSPDHFDCCARQHLHRPAFTPAPDPPCRPGVIRRPIPCRPAVPNRSCLASGSWMAAWGSSSTVPGLSGFRLRHALRCQRILIGLAEASLIAILDRVAFGRRVDRFLQSFIPGQEAGSLGTFRYRFDKGKMRPGGESLKWQRRPLIHSCHFCQWTRVDKSTLHRIGREFSAIAPVSGPFGPATSGAGHSA